MKKKKTIKKKIKFKKERKHLLLSRLSLGIGGDLSLLDLSRTSKTEHVFFPLHVKKAFLCYTALYKRTQEDIMV